MLIPRVTAYQIETLREILILGAATTCAQAKNSNPLHTRYAYLQARDIEGSRDAFGMAGGHSSVTSQERIIGNPGQQKQAIGRKNDVGQSHH